MSDLLLVPSKKPNKSSQSSPSGLSMPKSRCLTDSKASQEEEGGGGSSSLLNVGNTNSNPLKVNTYQTNFEHQSSGSALINQIFVPENATTKEVNIH